jgi:FKBP-type peptidyl-prolyl cis-trans isomerase
MASGDYARRFGSLFLASIFIFTSLAFTGIILWQSRQNQEDDSSNSDIPQEVRDQLAAQQEQQAEAERTENMLEGTQLEGFTPVSTPITELQIIDLVPGTGEEVKAGATVTAHYTGAYVVNGEIFQSSHDSGEPIPFGLNEVIAGWTEGVPGMKVGGKRRLIIPGEKAYGAAPEGYVPGSTSRPLGPLVFDIELVAVEQ